MKTRHCLALVATLAALSFCSQASAQTTFYFQFGDNGQTVGTGTFTFTTFPGDGTFPIADVGSFTMNYSFIDGNSYDQTDINSDLSDVNVVFSSYTPTVTRLQFGDTGSISGGGGLFGGSLDLGDLSEGLTFEPSDLGMQAYGEGALYSGNFFFGQYLATSAPFNSAPDGGSTIWYLGLGCCALALAGKGLSPRLSPVRV